MNEFDFPQGQIAVVDDTPANLRLLCGLLTSAGYKVRPFPRGQLFLDGVAHSLPDLILLDIQMPQMNGYEVCQQLKANEATKELPVIFISALNEAFDKVKGFQVGGIDYITKPFQAEEVLARVSTHLEIYRMKKMLQDTNFLQAQQLAQKNTELEILNQALKRSNLELQQKYKQLRELQLQLIQNEKMSALGNLVAGVAHEINNPIGFISGNLNCADDYIQDLIELLQLYQAEWSEPSEIILNKVEDIEVDYLIEDLPQIINSMRQGIERITEISKSMRTFSRTDNLTKIPFNLHEGIDSTLLILKHRLKSNEKRPEIEVVKKYGDLPEINCYPGQLNQVFMNLMANAIDAIEESNIGKTFEEIKAAGNRITITTEIHREKQQIIIRIRDNGMGIRWEVKDKIFDHLFTTKVVGKGTGLGLSISRQIVEEKHGGKINCSSELGKVTEFVIALPASSN